MKSKPNVSVLYAPGTNCEVETMEALRLAGGEPRLVFLRDLLTGKEEITGCDCFVVPGGFSYGDYPETGVAVAEFLAAHLPKLVAWGIPTLGICNGMQILVRAGLFGPGLAMDSNDCGAFVSRPIIHRVELSHCLWTKGLEGGIFTFPAAHGYGKLVGPNVQNVNVVMTYQGDSPSGGRIAAICDEWGGVMAMMDHLERRPDNEAGQMILRNVLSA